MKISSRSSIGVAVLAAVVFVASSAQASIINYGSLPAVDGITISNITETNSNGSGTYTYGVDLNAPSYYGPATFNGLALNIPISGTLPFAASAGANDSDLLGAKLSFEVTSQSPLLAAAFLSEIGDFFAGDGGSGGVDNSIFIFSDGNPPASNVGTVTAPMPFTSGATDTDMIWTAAAGASSNVLATSFTVVIDNDLHAAGSANPASFAFIEKKGITIDIGTPSGGTPNTPEPATLGVLSLGALSLVARRRRTV